MTDVGFMQKLKAWDAVEANSKRLNFFRSVIFCAYISILVIYDIILSHLDKVNHAYVQRIGCDLRPINSVIKIIMPDRILHNIDATFAGLSYSNESIYYIYLMIKLDISIPFIIGLNIVIFIMVFTNDRISGQLPTPYGFCGREGF